MVYRFGEIQTTPIGNLYRLMKAVVTNCAAALKTGSGGFKFGPGHELLYEGGNAKGIH
jgi:hypothetical protein